jgi:hypothetical protein
VLLDHYFDLHLDTFLDFLEENRSLASATLEITSKKHTLRSSRRRTPIRSRLRYLEIACSDATDGQALISSIALSKGAELRIYCSPLNLGGVVVNEVLSGISTTHLSNLQSPTFMEYRTHSRAIRLFGPNGSANFLGEGESRKFYKGDIYTGAANIRRLHLNTCEWKSSRPPPGPTVFRHLSLFPALETLAIECDTGLSRLLSALISNPPSSPSLKTLTFLDCIITEGFMEELMRFASDRKNTTLVRLHCVVILHPEGKSPGIASIRKLEDHVPVVDVQIATKIPTEMTEAWFGEQVDISSVSRTQTPLYHHWNFRVTIYVNVVSPTS